MDFENCYADRLAQAIEKKDSRLVVGIDPRLDRLPEELTGLEPEDALLRLGSGVDGKPYQDETQRPCRLHFAASVAT